MNFQESGLNSFQVSQDHPQYIKQNLDQTRTRMLSENERIPDEIRVFTNHYEKWKDKPEPLYSLSYLMTYNESLSPVSWEGITIKLVKQITDKLFVQPKGYFCNLRIRHLTEEELTKVRPDGDNDSETTSWGEYFRTDVYQDMMWYGWEENQRYCKDCGLKVGKGKSFCSSCLKKRKKDRRRKYKICGFDGCGKPRGFGIKSCDYHSKRNRQKRHKEEIVSCKDCGCDLGMRKNNSNRLYCDKCKKVREDIQKVKQLEFHKKWVKNRYHTDETFRLRNLEYQRNYRLRKQRQHTSIKQ